jgi:predicted MFS family arabinose efflux permease
VTGQQGATTPEPHLAKGQALRMSGRSIKTGYFALAAINTFASSYYFNYLFFHLHARFGFGNRENLWTSALYGFIYIFSAWQCGKFAQRHGFIRSLKLGFAGLALMMVLGGLLDSVVGELLVLAGYSVVLLFTWPALEALVSENESRAGVQHMVGIYNCTWSAAAALSYFTGGTLFEHLGRGAVYWIPAGLFLLQLGLVLWLEKKRAACPVLQPNPADTDPSPHPDPAALRQRISPAGFMKMAWLSNPFAYVAMNTVIAVMPGIAQRLNLNPAQVGWCCSVWMFARFGAFALLWRWTGWHYRFRWLLAAFVALIASFMALLMAPRLGVLIAAQVFFGAATGLIYYSSLFYSMDVGEASAEHGGLHEAAIGAGVFAGPAVGAAALQWMPYHSSSGVFAVSTLLLLGLGGLLYIWRSQRL